MMKRILIIAFMVLLNLSACAPDEVSPTEQNTPTNQTMSTVYNLDEDGYINNYFETINIPFKQGDNYEILSDKAQLAFYYRVKDNDGYLIDNGYHNGRGDLRFETKDNLLVLHYGLGGTYQWLRRYYDVANSRVSRFFETPLQTSNELIAYFTIHNEGEKPALVVQNIFDKSKYYKEFQRDFSPLVMNGTSETEFMDNSKLKISYATSPSDEVRV